MDKKIILNTFISQLNEFCEDTYNIFKNDKNILFAKDAIYAYSQFTPNKTIKLWKDFVVDPYRVFIDNKDYTFFINKDYSEDLKYMPYKDSIITKIDELRDYIKNLDNKNKDKALKYVENLIKLCDLYYNN